MSSLNGCAVVVVPADVEFAAEDRFDGLLLHGVEEVDSAKDVAVIGHGGGGLAQFAEVAGEFVYVAGAIEKGVIGVEMKMGKLCCHAPILGVESDCFAEDKWAGIRPDSSCGIIEKIARVRLRR